MTTAPPVSPRHRLLIGIVAVCILLGVGFYDFVLDPLPRTPFCTAQQRASAAYSVTHEGWNALTTTHVASPAVRDTTLLLRDLSVLEQKLVRVQATNYYVTSGAFFTTQHTSWVNPATVSNAEYATSALVATLRVQVADLVATKSLPTTTAQRATREMKVLTSDQQGLATASAQMC